MMGVGLIQRIQLREQPSGGAWTLSFEWREFSSAIDRTRYIGNHAG